ncbi:hypothetical protein ADEAN_000185700 [Angomonas deanei]|uniref:Uncharacterized protein n=1 Tax=Angomonas deanei TaxID=59799 RepID=A0A7G2C5L0_9TRYP|nr:hypothetical protein ADEAN_000185700 [Angomonas deanei]
MSTIDRLFKKADEKKKANHSGDPFLLFPAEEELDADESRHSAHDNGNDVGLSSTEHSRGAVPPEDVLGTSAPNQQEGADLEPGDLQWPLTGAFQYCFYYVLLHTNPPNRERDGILAEEDFMVANKVLKLTLDNHHEDNNTVKGTAASELLLQLCLSPPFHQPSYFSRLYFEQHCPPSFPVKEALETLTATEMIWHFTRTHPNKKQPSGAKYFAEPLLHVLNGERMAVLFRTLYSLQENNHHAPQTSSKKIEALQRKIKSILLVLRVGELKEFIQAFLPSSTTNNNIPSTKLEVIHSLLENPPPTSSSSAVQLQRLEESWRYTIGDIYQPHQTVKKSILFIVRLFHCMNGSFLSHSLTNPPSGETFPRDVLNISNKSKISFLREVMDSLHNPNDNDNNNNNNISKSLAAIYNHLSVPFPILYPFQQRLMCFVERNRSHQRWSSSFPFPPWISNPTPHHTIFSSSRLYV